MGARAWPSGCLCPSPDCLGCGTRFAQTVLAPNRGRDRGAATPAGALKWRHEIGAGREKANKDKDAGSSITHVEDDRRRARMTGT